LSQFHFRFKFFIAKDFFVAYNNNNYNNTTTTTTTTTRFMRGL